MPKFGNFSSAFAIKRGCRRPGSESKAYENYAFNQSQAEGDIFFGTTIIYPGKVGSKAAIFWLAHVRHSMGFYHPRAVDPRGGFCHCFKDDGTIYDAVTRHLVSSTRFVFTYPMAIETFFPSRKMSEIPYGHLPSS
jgi:hypothetical protein